ncbi:MAG: helix-turn-helix domain-containing protein [Bryobacteraceae bacterium]
MAQPTVTPNNQPEPKRTTPPAFMTTAEVAWLLRYTETTIRRQARAGTLPGVRYGKEWRFATSAVLRAYGSRLALPGY